MNIITAMTNERVIGNGGKIPWHISEEFQLFKEKTLGNVVIMGRKTYESIGKPLPQRTNLVVSKSMPSTPNVLVCRSLEEALMTAKRSKKGIYVIGGAQIYEQALPLASDLHVSWVRKYYEGDTHFPKINLDNDWEVFATRNREQFDYVHYQRKLK